MGSRVKDNPPRKRGPKPDALGKWGQQMGKGLNKPHSKGNFPQPPSKKGRGGR